jgi:hypothetical protein
MNPYAAKPLCDKCNDFRFLTKRVEARQSDLVPCPVCGPEGDSEHRETQASKERYAHFRETRWTERQTGPTISQMDLTPEEFKVYRKYQYEYPNVANRTILSWIEGQRYQPSKDEEFLKDARQKFKDWRSR